MTLTLDPPTVRWGGARVGSVDFDPVTHPTWGGGIAWYDKVVVSIVAGGRLRTRTAPRAFPSAGGPRAACQNSFIIAVFRPGRAWSAAGTAGWGRGPGHGQGHEQNRRK